MFKTGWAKPISGGHLNAFVDLRPGIPQDFTLPAMALNKTNMIRIIADQNNNIKDTSSRPQRALFVSYRVRQRAIGSYDSGLQDADNGRVW
ncbi:hypothetical protein PLESTF_001137800 [Pleodorina starrii]|nr:hypothetical protein PLESTF_001137800 [Pleodorina starrii]